MTQDKNNISKAWKGITIAGIIIYLSAISYQAYRVYSAEDSTSSDYSNLTIMGSMFLFMLIMLRPVFKKW
jgi:hypothetical protein